MNVEPVRSPDVMRRGWRSSEGENGSLELDHVLFGSGAKLSLRSFRSGSETVPLQVPAELDGDANPADALNVYSASPVGLRGFVSDTLAGRKPSPDFEDGWRAQQLVDAALRSNAERRWVNLRARTTAVRPRQTP